MPTPCAYHNFFYDLLFRLGFIGKGNNIFTETKENIAMCIVKKAENQRTAADIVICHNLDF